MKLLITMFTKLRDLYVRARARWISRGWVRRAIKAGEPVVPYHKTEAAAIENYQDGAAIDAAFFAECEQQTSTEFHMEIMRRFDSTLSHMSTIELRWACESKMPSIDFEQRVSETGAAYRTRLLMVLKNDS